MPTCATRASHWRWPRARLSRMDWTCSAYRRRRKCNGGQTHQAGLSRQREAILAGLDLALSGRTARTRLVGADPDQGLGADVAQEEPAAAESRSDRAEGIRAGGRRGRGEKTRAAEEDLRFLFGPA